MMDDGSDVRDLSDVSDVSDVSDLSDLSDRSDGSDGPWKMEDGRCLPAEAKASEMVTGSA